MWHIPANVAALIKLAPTPVACVFLLATSLPIVAAHAELPTQPAQIVRSYPHDRSAFTEGLLIRDGWLYESTGYEGHSFISKKSLTTGRTVQEIAIPAGLFGEGIAGWKDKLYSFVWHGGRGFVWNFADFQPAGSWSYTGEGWGMTSDDHHIIMSDGSSVLRFLQPGTMKVVHKLSVTAEGQPVTMLNELEYVHGEILANVWLTDRIARIDPASGRVRGWIDISSVWRRVGFISQDAVPNGIAYDHATDKLYITGKNWPLLFQIRTPTR